VTTQDRIAKSGTDRPRDNDFESWLVQGCSSTRSQSPGQQHFVMPCRTINNFLIHPNDADMHPILLLTL
jgi:hypothetical protein